MSNLAEQLKREITERGEKSPVAQMIRKQIAAQESGQSFQEMYLTGSYKKSGSTNETPPSGSIANDESQQEE